jgi:hypothetical protein
MAHLTRVTPEYEKFDDHAKPRHGMLGPFSSADQIALLATARFLSVPRQPALPSADRYNFLTECDRNIFQLCMGLFSVNLQGANGRGVRRPDALNSGSGSATDDLLQLGSVDFIDENAGGPGVRVLQRQRGKAIKVPNPPHVAVPINETKPIPPGTFLFVGRGLINKTFKSGANHHLFRVPPHSH